MNLFDVLFAKKLAGGGSPFPPVIKRVTGNPVEFSDAAAAPIVKLTSEITGYQEGTGTPSPDNIRPIVAYNSGTVTRCGKNLMPNRFVGSTDYGITFTKNNDGTYTFNGTNNRGSAFDVYLNAPTGTRIDTTYDATLLPGTYKFSGISGGSSSTYRLYIALNEEGQSSTYYGTNDGEGTFTITSIKKASLFVRIYTGQTFNNMKVYPMLRNSVVTDSNFEPYNGTDHTVNFSQSIYSGSADFVGGSAKCDMPVIQVGGTGFFIASNGVFYNDSGILTGVSLDTSDLVQTITDRYDFYGIITATGDLVGHDGCFGLQIIGSNVRVAINDSRYTTSTDFQNYLTGNPLKIAYKLATPTTETIPPTNLPIKSLSGYNHISSSTGDMVVDYITDAYQNFVDTTERAIPNTRKSGPKAMDIFMTLDEPGVDEPEKEVDAPLDETEKTLDEPKEDAKK